ncbi:NAD(P)/FAD-dependent oxidoreductase [Aquicoccus sp. G2-2]|uniref:NAD(P)/FAD-dependent oxidoreductase n=1 Tax=Aquicoccus sp. G2-2 TaxID=3092120 RepID=UPI002AE0A707|nr:FAD-binding oxidoreductase [Aquicoccus sp. G2-2]MEA1113891.1 FAD-binding oxidoreductase [Aquicoccus sp. G2-2]
MSDILVIGGGIAGLSAAARLAPHAKITVLEAEDALAYHASGRSAALYAADYGAPSVVELSQASGAFYLEGDRRYCSPRGVLFLASAEERAAFEHDCAEMALDEITMDEASALVPILNRDKVAFAGLSHAPQDIDTDLLVQDFTRIIRANGGAIHLKTKVSTITRDARWRVTAGDQVYEAETLIDAAGPWADTIAQMAGVAPIGLQPMRRSMARIPAPGGHDLSSWPMFFGTGGQWYAKPDAGQLIVSPSEEHPMEPHDAWADDMVIAEGLARYEEMVTEPVTRLTANWAGLRTFAPDRTLVLGPAPQDAGFIWCAGQGGYGFQTAPAASQLVADLTLGRAPALDPALVAALSPRRFA